MAAVNFTDIIDGVFDTVSQPSWQSYCLTNLRNVTDWQGILTDRSGNLMENWTTDTWGLTEAGCIAYCGSGTMPYPFNYGTFANAMTNYLLPWLALTAQLPYETGDPGASVMSFCLAVGSPVLITYSLTLTILNRRWTRTYFKDLKQKANTLAVRQRAPNYDRRVRAAQFFLQESQQVPIRCNQEKGWLASLIVLPGNIEWWEQLESRLKATRRGFSPSLIAQMSLAIIAWLLTIFAAFISSLGDPDTALQIASGSLWLWLVPVVLGWVMVGTQTSDHSIEDALTASPAWRARDPPLVYQTPQTQQDGDQYKERTDQKGLECRSGLSPQPHGNPTAAGALQWSNITNLKVQGWLGFSVIGDEEIKGPTYNYARLFTWWQAADTIGKSIFATLDNISEGNICHLTHLPRLPATPVPQQWHDEHKDFLVDNIAISDYCGLRDPLNYKPYPDFTDLPAPIYMRMGVAAIIAIVVQWGTAGDSIMTAYLTPSIGLGCRSGSYLVYAVASTVAWFLLFMSKWFSHAAMLGYQDQILRNPSTNFTSTNINDPKQYLRPLSHTIVCALAVSLRLAGKILCVLNTVWLVYTSFAEFVGGFDNCWCMSDYPSLRGNGYVVLFKTAHDLAASASLPWGGGLAMSIAIIFTVVSVFAMGSWQPEQ